MKSPAKKCNHLGKGTAPRCAHDECWFVYFSMWPGVARLLQQVIGQNGRQYAISLWGEKYVKRVARFSEGRMKGER